MKINAPPQTLNRYFQVLESYFDSVLLPPEMFAAIKQVASPFPDSICNFFGFECRLSDRSQRSDFALNLTAQGGELLANLASARDKSGFSPQSQEWERVSHFLQEWGKTSDDPFADVGCVWLEFDIKSPLPKQVAPGLILFGYWLDTNISKVPVRRPLNWLTQKALPILRGETLSSELEQHILSCIEQASVYTDYFQVGVMLTRPVDAVRLCLFNIKPGQILDYLAAIGWSGAEEKLEKAITDFSGLVDYLCLHIDIGSKFIYPRIGLELLYDDLQPWNRQPHREPRWYSLFDRLVEEGACLPSKRDAILAWPGYSQFESANTSGRLLRGLQHIKLVCKPDEPLEAKAYYGACLIPQATEAPKTEFKVKAPREQAVVHTTKSKVERAIDRGLVFLLISRDNRGWWQDFFLPAGASDAWVTGYVGTVLAKLKNPLAQDAAENAWQLLTQQRSEAGWGYHAEVTTDADSTLWVLHLAQALGREKEESAQRGHQFLQQHLNPDSGFTTYAQEEDIRNYVNMPPGLISFDGWFSSHPCVTAAAASLKEWQKVVRPYLLTNQQDDGSWHSYWWLADEYATALAVKVIDDSEALEKALEWGRERLLYWLEAPQPSDFAIAWCLEILSRDSSPASQEVIKQGKELLLARQQPNGSWLPSAQLLVPQPDCVDSKKIENWKLWTSQAGGNLSLEQVLENTFNIYSLDNQGIFTTATVMRALHSLKTGEVQP